MKYDKTEIQLHLTEERRWNSALAKVKLSHGSGSIALDIAIRKARLALKHKRNPKQTRRIIAIVCSPILTEPKPLIKVAKELKKNKLSLDIICYGLPEDHESKTVEKLRDMVKACNRTDNCNFLHLEDESQISLSDALMGSPIAYGFGNQPQPAAAQAPAANAAPVPPGMEGIDIDPQTDPELYHAIRLSMEQARQEAANREPEEPQVSAEQNSEEPAVPDAEMENTEQPAAQESAPIIEAPVQEVPSPAPDQEEMEEDDDDDDELAAAIALSLAMEEEEEPAAQPAPDAQEQEQEEFLADLLDDLPGVEKDELDINEIMNLVAESEASEKKDKDSSNDKKDS